MAFCGVCFLRGLVGNMAGGVMLVVLQGNNKWGGFDSTNVGCRYWGGRKIRRYPKG